MGRAGACRLRLRPCLSRFSDEGKFYSARLFGVLDRADLNAVTAEVERLEDEGALRIG